jgi:hypothetical protein
VQREITPLWGEKKVVLRQTPRAVTRFGGLSVFIEFLGKIGSTQQVEYPHEVARQNYGASSTVSR